MAKQFYVLKVASNKEEQIRDTLIQKVRLEGLGDEGSGVVGRVMVPTEQVIKAAPGKQGGRRSYARKLYPGYVIVEMEMKGDGTVPEQAWFVFKETSGVGDFIGSGGDRDKAGKPTPMTAGDVEKMLAVVEGTTAAPVQVSVEFKKGQHVKIKEGPFANFEGEIEEIVAATNRVKVVVTIFGRKTPLDLETWQIEGT